MKTRLPIQAIGTEFMINAIIPSDFKMASDKTSNGYKFINLLYGVEVDQFRSRLQQIYDNSFLETMDLSDEGVLYEVYLSGIPNAQFLNSSTGENIKIKISNWGETGGDSEFWDGPPTRVILTDTVSISGIVQSGNVAGLNYFRSNASGYGYFLVSTDLDQRDYLAYSGSLWQVQLDNVGNILSSTGTWPGVKTYDHASQGHDDILYPLGSNYLYKTYPLTRTIKDNSGVFRTIDHYEPYLGWVRDNDLNVVANASYPTEYYYDSNGKKIWHRTAFNNPYGSGNYTVEHLPLKNIPISGTLKIYDIDNLDISGNATEISSSGTTIYRLQSANMHVGTATGVFDPTYVGYSSIVPADRGFGAIEGLEAAPILTTSWEYQRASGYIDEDTMNYIEGSGEIYNQIKMTNPISRYVAEYKYIDYSKANYVTSLEATKYLSLETLDPLFSIKNVFNNQRILEYSFTKDPTYKNDRARFITFDGWTIRPNSRISKIAFNLPLTIEQGLLQDFKAVSGKKSSAGYDGFVPDIVTTRIYALNCPFSSDVYLGTVTENDISGNDNYLTWVNSGSNEIYKYPIDTSYGKKIRYISDSCYYKTTTQNFLKDNTYFRFRFRAQTPQSLVLMELSEASSNKYIKVQVSDQGSISIISNGIEQYYSFDKFAFGYDFHDLIIRYRPDPNFTEDPVFDLYIKGSLGYTKARGFTREVTSQIFSSTYLHVYKNCTIDADIFQIYYETNYGDTL